MIKILQIIACKTITVLIKAIVSASLLLPTFSPRAFAQILQNFFIALAVGLEPTTYRLEVCCSIRLSYEDVVDSEWLEHSTCRLWVGCSNQLSYESVNKMERRDLLYYPQQGTTVSSANVLVLLSLCSPFGIAQDSDTLSSLRPRVFSHFPVEDS